MRTIVIIAAAAALTAGAAASAAPFSLTASTDADRHEAKEDRSGLVNTLIRTTADAFGIVFSAGDHEEDDFVLRYREREEGCTADESAEAEGEAKDAKKKTPAGPEPIYFGF